MNEMECIRRVSGGKCDKRTEFGCPIECESLNHLFEAPYFIYRFFGTVDQPWPKAQVEEPEEYTVLLYVGVTNNLGERLKQHSKDKHWFWRTTHVRAAYVGTKQQALEEEAAAIEYETPLFNVQGNCR